MTLHKNDYAHIKRIPYADFISGLKEYGQHTAAAEIDQILMYSTKGGYDTPGCWNCKHRFEYRPPNTQAHISCSRHGETSSIGFSCADHLIDFIIGQYESVQIGGQSSPSNVSRLYP